MWTVHDVHGVHGGVQVVSGYRLSDRVPSLSVGPTPRDTTVAHGGAPAAAAPAPIAVVVPLRLVSLGNRREHWRARARRVRLEITIVSAALAAHTPPPLPVVVEIQRVGWNRLDPDGLVGAAKSGCIDAVAAWLGVDDRDRRIHWWLSQHVAREVRLVRDTRGRCRREAAASVRLTIREWQPDDGDDRLRVLGEGKHA